MASTYDDQSIDWIESDNGIHKPFLISDPDSDDLKTLSLSVIMPHRRIILQSKVTV